MITIPVQLSEELAERVRPLQDRLPEIIELGLRQWRKQPALTPRQTRRAAMGSPGSR